MRTPQATRLTRESFWELKARVREEREARSAKVRARITVHLGTCGIASGASKVLERLSHAIREKGITDVQVIPSGCAGLCSREPMVTVETKGGRPAKYVDVDPKKITRILEEHVVGGTIVEQFLIGIGDEITL